MSIGFIRAGLAMKCGLAVAIVALLLLAGACGGDSASPKAKASGEHATTEDVERDLKFDARVSDFDVDGNKLVVNVNDRWMSSPAGMQQTAAKRWLERWQTAKEAEGQSAKDAKVVVRFNGDDILTVNAGGVTVVAKAKSEEK